MELLTPNGQTNHGPPDPLPEVTPESCAIGLREMEISQEAVDQLDRLEKSPSPVSPIAPKDLPEVVTYAIRGCQYPDCGVETRAYVEINGKSYCEKHAPLVTFGEIVGGQIEQVIAEAVNGDTKVSADKDFARCGS